MYIVELKRNDTLLYVASLTATSVSFTEDWKLAERFKLDALPKPEDIEPYAHGAKVIGYAPV